MSPVDQAAETLVWKRPPSQDACDELDVDIERLPPG
jgi:hypothetical protein